MAATTEAGARRAIFYAFLANLGIAIAKGAAAFATGSGAMLAEAVHSAADCANQVLLFVGLSRARRPPTEEHPLGYGKAVFFWSFLVAIMLFSMGGLFSVYEGVHKLAEARDHSGLERPWIAIAVLSIGVVLEGLSLAGALRETRHERRGLSLWTWFRRSRSGALVTVVGEDFAALLGLSFALVAVVASMLTGNLLYDALGTIAIGVLLLVIAVLVAVEVKSLLIGESAEPELREGISDFVEARPEVAELLNLITLQLGPQVMVALKARMTETADAGRLVADVNACERALRENFPEVRWVFFEPDLLR